MSTRALCADAGAVRRVGSLLERRLARLDDDAVIERRDREMRAYIRSLVSLRLADADPLTIDWSGPAGRAKITAILEGTFRFIEAEEGP